MKILKFGGTSLANAEAIRQVGQIIEANEDKICVVVSAVGGVTDRLQALAEKALISSEEYNAHLASIISNHRTILNELTGSESSAELESIFDDLGQICKGIGLTKEKTPRSLDIILSSGERMSSIIFTTYLKSQSVDAARWASERVIMTDDDFGNAKVDFEASLESLPAKDALKKVNIFPGFVGGTKNGQITTLGRGGSDYSAAILANLFDAKELEIWTDVDGLMTADPRLVKNSKLIPRVSYEEAFELSHFGAKVIYKPSILPVMRKEIPTRIKNTFNPTSEGTLISNEVPAELIRGISSISRISLFIISGRALTDVPKFPSELFDALTSAAVKLVFITQSSSDNSITLGFHSQDVPLVTTVLNDRFEDLLSKNLIDPIDIRDGYSLLALVGTNMKNQVGISGKMFDILGRNGVSINAIAQGSSERNISAVISQKDLSKSINVLHEGFFLSESKRINLFIVGTGNVGAAFLDQLTKQFKFLKEHHQLNVKLIGISNSRKMIFDRDGIPLSKWKQKLELGDLASKEAFFEKMFDLNLRNSIFIDNTASSEVAGTYAEILKHSISVVTPNKIAATRSMTDYLELKQLAKRYRCQFLFETNVCAGLPVLSTLSDLIRSGDRMKKIEAVLSGTLNFIFNEYNGEKPFADVIRKAKDLGYSEPDPRLDLSGEDVMRKLLILVRESGFQMEMNEIKMNSFLPDSCQGNDSLDTFYEQVEKAENHFSTLFQNASDNRCRLKMVASFDGESARVGLKEIEESHPFYNLEGKDNIVLFYTDRYSDQPLVIKGAGAGAEVTASGVFADVLRISQAD